MFQTNRVSLVLASTSVLLATVIFSLLAPRYSCIPLLNSTGQQLAQMFLPDNITLNLEQMSQTAMNPMWLNNQSMTDLFSHAADIMNNTQADSVLFEIDPVTEGGTPGANNQSAMVLAVRENQTQSDASHTDLLRQYQMYFVNLQSDGPNQLNTVPPQSGPNAMVSEADQAINAAVNNIAASGPTYWRIVSNFFKNQANAFIGTIMMPLNVGAKAMQQSVQEHAEYVLAGSRYGVRVSKPIFLTAVRLGNIIDQLVLNITSDQVNQIENVEFNSKQMVDNAIDSAGDTISGGARLVMQYAVRPVAAFTGFNIHLLGRTLTGLGTGIHRTGSTINLAGDGLRLGAQSAVSAGATAVAWAMDNSTSFLPATPRPSTTPSPL